MLYRYDPPTAKRILSLEAIMDKSLGAALAPQAVTEKRVRLAELLALKSKVGFMDELALILIMFASLSVVSEGNVFHPPDIVAPWVRALRLLRYAFVHPQRYAWL